MGFIPDLSDVKEAAAVSAGRYDTVIESAVAGPNKAGDGENILAMIGIEGNDEAATVRHYIPIPQESDPKDKMLNKARALKRFCAVYKIPELSNSEELAASMVGARANVELTVEEFEGNQNNKLKLPKFSTDTAGKGSPPRRG